MIIMASYKDGHSLGYADNASPLQILDNSGFVIKRISSVQLPDNTNLTSRGRNIIISFTISISLSLS
jgi:hypothetical protein